MIRVGLELGEGYIAIVPYGEQSNSNCFIETDSLDFIEIAMQGIIRMQIHEHLQQLARADDDGMPVYEENQND
jgi:hypothetical protein